MPFLGIDQSLRATGLCLLSDEGNVISLVTVDPKTRRGAERLAYIQREARGLFLQGVSFVALEGYAYNSTSHHHALGEAGGVLKLLAFELEVPAVTVAPASLKKFATTNPRATKDEMVEAAKAATKGQRVVFVDDNQADAFFLAVIARYIAQEVNPTKRSQLEVLHQIKHPTRTCRRRVRRLVKHAL